jgi:hypothetical protein
VRALTAKGALLLLVAACTSATGTLHSEGEKWGTWRSSVADCTSGAHHGFFGVDLFDGAGNQLLRFVKSPVGEDTFMVVLGGPGGSKLQSLAPGSCRSLKGSVAERGAMVNHVRNVAGSLDIDCRVGSSRLTAHADFKGCH